MKRVVRIVFLYVNLLAIVLLLATYLVTKINPGKFWFPSVFGLAFPYLLLTNVLFIGFWLLVYKRYMFLSLVVVVLGMHTIRTYIQFFPNKTKNEDGIKVLSYNVYHFYSYFDNSKNDNSILKFIADQHANIICLQETKLQKEGILNPLKLKSMFPGINHCQLAHQSRWGGPVTFTSYPIVSMGELRFEDTKNMVIFTDLKINKDTVRVYNCHLQSYRLNATDYSVIDTLDLETVKMKDLRRIVSKIKWGYIYRSEQVILLTKHIESCHYPVIVCGDFNDTPISFTYGKISSLLKDSFVESGRGVSDTYRGEMPNYRIDYIFHSKHFRAYNYTRFEVDFSDHYPISTLLKTVEDN